MDVAFVGGLRAGGVALAAWFVDGFESEFSFSLPSLKRVEGPESASFSFSCCRGFRSRVVSTLVERTNPLAICGRGRGGGNSFAGLSKGSFGILAGALGTFWGGSFSGSRGDASTGAVRIGGGERGLGVDAFCGLAIGLGFKMGFGAFGLGDGCGARGRDEGEVMLGLGDRGAICCVEFLNGGGSVGVLRCSENGGGAKIWRAGCGASCRGTFDKIGLGWKACCV